MLAQAKHRPPALAEAIADKNLKVFHVRKSQAGRAGNLYLRT